MCVCVCVCVCVCGGGGGGTGSASASYLPQLAGGCVALGTSTSSGAGPWYNYKGGITGTTSGHQWPLIHFFCVCVCVCVCVYVRMSILYWRAALSCNAQLLSSLLFLTTYRVLL